MLPALMDSTANKTVLKTDARCTVPLEGPVGLAGSKHGRLCAGQRAPWQPKGSLQTPVCPASPVFREGGGEGVKELDGGCGDGGSREAGQGLSKRPL